MFHHLAQMLSQFCQFPTSPGRTGQRVEQPKSRSTQPRFARRCVTLYKQHTCWGSLPVGPRRILCDVQRDGLCLETDCGVIPHGVDAFKVSDNVGYDKGSPQVYAQIS